MIGSPDDSLGRMFFPVLATVAESEVNLLRMRTREGTTIAGAPAPAGPAPRTAA